MSAPVLSHALPLPADDLHQVDRNLNLLSAIGILEADQRMELNILENVENRVAAGRGGNGCRNNDASASAASGK